MPQTTDRRLYLTTDKSRVVEDGDAEATFLFAAEGDEISDDDVKKYGIKFAKSKAESEATESDGAEKSEAASATKAQRAGANKAEQPSEDKGSA